MVHASKQDRLLLKSFVDTIDTLKRGVATYSMTNIDLEFNIEEYKHYDGIMDELVLKGAVAALRQLSEDNPSNVTFERVCNTLSKIYRGSSAEDVEDIREYKKAWKTFFDREEAVLALAGKSNLRTNRDLVRFLSYSGGIHTDFDNGSYEERINIEASDSFRFLKVQLVMVMLTTVNLSHVLIEAFIEPLGV